MATILDRLAKHARVRVQEAKSRVSLEEIRQRAYTIACAEREEEQFRFEKALSGEGMHFICEVKKASPSKGLIAPDFPYLAIAREYEAAGAECISVLTEPKWFLGSDRYLQEITQQVKVPCIRKDFTIDPYMIYEAKLLGASAVLLICSLLDARTLGAYLETAQSLGLSALVEAHNEEEIRMALHAGARMIGVNNRNLKDFTVDVSNAERLRSLVPEHVLFVAESGIRDASDVSAMLRAGANACLVGETLMRAKDKAATLRTLRGGTGEGARSEPRTLSRGMGESGRSEPRTLSSGMGESGRSEPQTLRGGSEEGVRIKLCGLRREEEIALVNAVHPDYAGFILARGRRRTVTPDRMRELSAALAPGIRRVAVFLDQDEEYVASVAKEPFVDLIQLHGSESEEMIRTLRETCKKPVIKAFRIDSASDVERAQQSCADYVLLDHGNGGTGEAFDWSLVRALKRPFFLAGGLDPENVAGAIRCTAPWAVDVSSGVETDGRKDPEKIRRFVEAVRQVSRR